MASTIGISCRPGTEKTVEYVVVLWAWIMVKFLVLLLYKSGGPLLSDEPVQM